jgi:hypothetical protein
MCQILVTLNAIQTTGNEMKPHVMFESHLMKDTTIQTYLDIFIFRKTMSQMGS